MFESQFPTFRLEPQISDSDYHFISRFSDDYEELTFSLSQEKYDAITIDFEMPWINSVQSQKIDLDIESDQFASLTQIDDIISQDQTFNQIHKEFSSDDSNFVEQTQNIVEKNLASNNLSKLPNSKFSQQEQKDISSTIDKCSLEIEQLLNHNSTQYDTASGDSETKDQSDFQSQGKRSKVRKYVILKSMMRQFKNYYKNDFLKRSVNFKDKNLKNNSHYCKNLLEYIEQENFIQEYQKQRKRSKLIERNSRCFNQECAIFLGNLIFKQQPHFNKEDSNLTKKNNIMRKKILYNISNSSIQKIASENFPFRILLNTFLKEQKDEILKEDIKNYQERIVYKELYKYLLNLVQ